MKITGRRGDVVLTVESPNILPRSKNQKGRPASPPQFAVKTADGGYGLFLSLPKEKTTRSKDTRENRYCCFITPDEFERMRAGDFFAFAAFALAKIEKRRETETEQGKLDALVSLIESLTGSSQTRAATA